MAEDKDKALDVALGQIEKQFGKGAIMRLGQGAGQEIHLGAANKTGHEQGIGAFIQF